MKRSARAEAASVAKKAKLAEEEKIAGSWETIGTASKGLCPVLHGKHKALKGSEVIAGFDIDWTIIATKSGRQFPTGPSDWKFWHDSVPEKLRELHKNGTKIVFFTNQRGLEKGRSTPQEFQRKADAIIHELGVPVEVYVSTSESQYRKPSPEMWRHMAEHCNDGLAVDMSASIYVGDAAGRAKGWKAGAKKDFSCSDRMFAANIGVPFKTPEEYFLDEEVAEFQWGVPKASTLVSNPDEMPTVNIPGTKELVVLVGMPASGKSTFAKTYFVPHGYIHVNRDMLGTAEKCLKVARESLAAGKSVVVDNTNPSPATRADYISIATAAKVRPRCFFLTAPFQLSQHLNYHRQNISEGKQRRVPDVGYRVYQSKFEEPSVDEGFEEVLHVPFVPRFSSDKEKQAFDLWT